MGNFFGQKGLPHANPDGEPTEPEKEIISQSSGSSESSDTGESSREISSRAAQARMTEKRVCGKRK